MAEAPVPLSPGRAAVAAVSAGCYAAAGAQASSSLLRDDPWDWVRMLANWAIYAVVALGLRQLVRVGFALAPDVRAVRTAVADAIRTGKLPIDADPDVWRARLAVEDREFRRARWALLGMTQLVAVLVAAAAYSADAPAPGAWGLAVALAAFAVIPFRWWGGRLRRVHALQVRLDA